MVPTLLEVSLSQPSAVQRLPSTFSRRPSAVDLQPSIFSRRSSAVDLQPSIFSRRSSAVRLSGQSLVVNLRLSAISFSRQFGLQFSHSNSFSLPPSAANFQPQLSAASRQLSAGSHQLSTLSL